MKEEPNRHLVCFFHSAILLVDQTITSASHLTRLLQNHHCELLHLQAPRPPLSSLRLRQESSSACLQGDAQTLHSMRLLALLLLLLSRRGAPSAARHTSCCRAGCARLRCVEKQLECLPTEREAPSSPCSACEECCVEAMEGLRRSLWVLVEGAAWREGDEQEGQDERECLEEGWRGEGECLLAQGSKTHREGAQQAGRRTGIWKKEG